MMLAGGWLPRIGPRISAMAGFGGGAALVSQAGGFLITRLGYTPFQTFFVFGILFFCLVGRAGAAAGGHGGSDPVPNQTDQ